MRSIRARKASGPSSARTHRLPAMNRARNDNGVFTNHPPDGGYEAYNAHGDEQRAFAVALRGQGYRTALMGKYLNGYQPTDDPPLGYDQWDVAGDGYPEFDYTLNQNGIPQP